MHIVFFLFLFSQLDYLMELSDFLLEESGQDTNIHVCHGTKNEKEPDDMSPVGHDLGCFWVDASINKKTSTRDCIKKQLELLVTDTRDD